ncbi:hypothetical protein [Moritella sp. 5]|uniref:hypothetical protein n=1 Tax=Moritella sp. 5 TaxID=2746231 RepID=UPI001BA4D676|nr:hypothetical protein [Moritella sp. 5]
MSYKLILLSELKPTDLKMVLRPYVAIDIIRECHLNHTQIWDLDWHNDHADFMASPADKYTRVIDKLLLGHIVLLQWPQAQFDGVINDSGNVHQSMTMGIDNEVLVSKVRTLQASIIKQESHSPAAESKPLSKPIIAPVNTTTAPARAIQDAAVAGPFEIEVELLDETDTPIANAEYILKLATDEERTGQLDGNGYKLFSGAEYKRSQIHFPQYEGYDWERGAASQRNQQVSSSQKKALQSRHMEATQQNIPSYLTGDAPETTMHPSYPVIKNTRVFPDENVRALLTENNHDVMLLTLPEIFEVLQSWGWKDTKETWVETTQSTGGQVLINYGVNGKDVVTTSMIIAKLGDFGIKATVYMNHKGTELIKFTGYAGVRQILNAPVFGLKNPKVVDVGIGKYGLKNSIIQGARVTFYVAAAYRTIDFILNDETSLAEFIGSLATDVAKIGIASAISWGVGGLVVASTSFVTAPLAIVVLVGLGASIALNILDEKYEVTDHVVKYLERAQQEVMEKAKEIENGFWDLGGMFIDGFLDTGKEIIESEIKNYVKKGISQLTPRIL